MKAKFVDMYLDIAHRVAQESSAVRLKVGALAVAQDRILSYGYNGTFAGHSNECETKVFNSDPGFTTGDEELQKFPYVDFDSGRRFKLVTKPEVIHAEMNMISKLAKLSGGAQGADCFITHAPCLECAKLVAVAGFSKVWYRSSYRDEAGINFLKTCNIHAEKVD